MIRHPDVSTSMRLQRLNRILPAVQHYRVQSFLGPSVKAQIGNYLMSSFWLIDKLISSVKIFQTNFLSTARTSSRYGIASIMIKSIGSVPNCEILVPSKVQVGRIDICTHFPTQICNWQSVTLNAAISISSYLNVMD